MGDMPYDSWTPNREEDWDFIAHARSDVPDLLAALEVAVAALEEIEAGGEHYGVTMDQFRRQATIQARDALKKIGWRKE